MNSAGIIAGTLESGNVALFEAGRWRDTGLAGVVLDFNENGWLLINTNGAFQKLRKPDGTITDVPFRSQRLDNQNRVYGTEPVRRVSTQNAVRAFRLTAGGAPEYFGGEILAQAGDEFTTEETVEIHSIGADGTVFLETVHSGGISNGLPSITTYQIAPDGATTTLNVTLFRLPSALPDKIEDLRFGPSNTGSSPNQVRALPLPGGGMVATIQIFNLSSFHTYYYKNGVYTLLPEQSEVLLQTTTGEVVLRDILSGKLQRVDESGARTDTIFVTSSYPVVATNGTNLAVAQGPGGKAAFLQVSKFLPDPNGQIVVTVKSAGGNPPEATDWKANRTDVALSADGKALELWAYALPSTDGPARALHFIWTSPQGIASAGGTTGTVQLYGSAPGSNALGLLYTSTTASLTVSALGSRSIQLHLETFLAGVASKRPGQQISISLDLTHGWPARI